MAKITEKDGGSKSDKKIHKKAIVDFVGSLSAEHKMLVVLKKQLYGGKWEPMYLDLKNRLAGRPYIFKLVNRINDDIERIDQMMQFEKHNDIDLCDYIDNIE